MKIPINEIFVSLDGEVNRWGQGKPTVFIRTQGCNLSCSYCDTPETQSLIGGKDMSITEIVDIVLASHIRKVTITGGEPLIWFEEVRELINVFVAYHILVSVETNGTIPLPAGLSHNKNVCFVVDFKSGADFDKFLNKHKDTGSLIVKFMVEDEDDFKDVCRFHSEMRKVMPEWEFAMSPVHGVIDESDIVSWIISHSASFPFISEVVVNTQIHKLIFPTGEKNHVLV